MTLSWLKRNSIWLIIAAISLVASYFSVVIARYALGAELYEEMPHFRKLVLAIANGVGVFMVCMFYIIWRKSLDSANQEKEKVEEELKENNKRLLYQAESKTFLTDMSASMHSAQSLGEFASVFFGSIAPKFSIIYGAFYVSDDMCIMLEPAGGFGVIKYDLEPIPYGHGLVGQCAKDNREIIVFKPKDSGLKILWGGGEIQPETLVIKPLVQSEKVMAVAVMVMADACTDLQRSFMTSIIETASLSLEILLRNLATKKQADMLKRQQDRLEQTEAWYRGIIESSPDGMLVVDESGTIILANTKAEQMFGYEKSSLTDMSVDKLVPESARGHHAALREKYMEDGTSRPMGDKNAELTGIMADGSEFAVEIGLSGLPSLSGWGNNVCVTLRDISERKRDEALIKDRFSFFREMVDTLPFPVFYKGGDGCYLGVNTAYEKAFNVSRREIVGKALTGMTFMSDEEKRIYKAEQDDAISAGGSFSREISLPFADGRVHDVIYSISGLRHSDSGSAGLVGSLVDVSDRKKIDDMEKFHKIAIGRENRIIELKSEINGLLGEMGREIKYNSTDADEKTEQNDKAEQKLSTDMRYEFETLVRNENFKELFDSFCETVGVAAAIIDVDGVILSASRWQRVCTDFHRQNNKSCTNCIESDTELASRLDDGSEFTSYRCKNGMTDCASPIVVEGTHLANVFIGQFHITEPDRAFFAKQAEEFGFDAEKYLEAVLEAPVVDETKMPHILGFLANFARLIGSLAVKQSMLKQAQYNAVRKNVELQAERKAAISLAEDAVR